MRILSIIVCLFVSITAYAAKENKDLTVETWLSLTKSSQKIQCANHKLTYDAAVKRSSKEKIKVSKQSMSLACECLPKEIDAYINGSSSKHKSTIVSAKQFQKIITPVLNICIAKQLRQHISSNCIDDTSVVKNLAKRKSYCKCFSAKLDKLSDKNIGDAALQANKDFRARAAALRDGKPAPKKTSSPLDKIEASCKRKIK